MKNEVKKQTGITLIALVITIIVLLILAGVTIATLTGDNGILSKTNEAKEKNNKESIKEQIKVEIMGEQSGNEGKIAEDVLISILEKYGKLNGEGELKEQTLTTKEGNYEIKVSELFQGEIGKAEVPETPAQLLASQVQVGDFVNYDAGEWTETVEATKINGTFGGYAKGQSKNRGIYGGSQYTGGWQVLKIQDNIVEIIHANCPARYFRQNSYSQSTSVTHLNEFCKNHFLNNQFASDARSTEYTKDYSILSNSSMLNGLTYFWFATTGGNNLWAWCTERATDTAGSSYSPWYVRPVVVLKPEVKTNGKADNGYGQSGWVLIL